MIIQRESLAQLIREAQLASVEPEYIADYILTSVKALKITSGVTVSQDITADARNYAAFMMDIGKAVVDNVAKLRQTPKGETIAEILYIGG